MFIEQPIFDADFVSRLRRSDAVAEGEFFGHFSKALWVKLRHSGQPPELIEDIRQETLLRVLRHLRSEKQFTEPERLGAFVHAVCRNVTLEFQRSHTRHPQFPKAAPDPPDATDNQEKQMALGERRKLVHDVLAELSPKERLALGMVYLQELDRDEACRQLRIGDGNLRVILHRAKLQFRRFLERRMRASGVV